MPKPKFVQIHALQNYTGVLLNRDDSGLAKTMPYGGVTRTRISSQCLKSHWRRDQGQYSLSNITPDPVRTKELVYQAIMKRVIEHADNPDEETAAAVISALNTGIYGRNADDSRSRQPLLFGEAEVNYLVQKTLDILETNPEPDEARVAAEKLFSKKGEADNFSTFRQGLLMPAGIVGAMFGRMVTSDPEANLDAPVHVAHAFTTHSEEKETDYFTAMEELSEEPGAGHIGETEINSGIYYVYAAVDIARLTANTTGQPPEEWLSADRELAAEAVASLLGLVATVSPGAKKGSTAPYGYAKFLMIEAGERQPRSLSGAYRKPSKPDFSDALERIRSETERNDQTYGEHETRRTAVNMPGEPQGSTLAEMIQWTKTAVMQGEA